MSSQLRAIIIHCRTQSNPTVSRLYEPLNADHGTRHGLPWSMSSAECYSKNDAKRPALLHHHKDERISVRILGSSDILDTQHTHTHTLRGKPAFSHADLSPLAQIGFLTLSGQSAASLSVTRARCLLLAILWFSDWG